MGADRDAAGLDGVAALRADPCGAHLDGAGLGSGETGGVAGARGIAGPMAGHAGVEAVVNIATPKVTACAFGGENLDQLFITTPQETWVTGCVDASKGNLVDMNGKSVVPPDNPI